MEVRKKKLIAHMCHHKCGTHAIYHVLRDVCREFGWNFQYCPQHKLREDTDVWVENHSHIDFSKLTHKEIIGSHMVRHPASLIYSASKYHKKTNEPWCRKPIANLGNMSYQGIMNGLDEEKGMLFEMKNEEFLESSRRTIRDMYAWDYDKPNFLEVRFEDLMSNFDEVLRNLFKFYGFTRGQIIKGLEIAQQHKLENIDKNELNREVHITNKNLNFEEWRNIFYNNNRLLKGFKKSYPREVFKKLGYCEDKDFIRRLDELEEDWCSMREYMRKDLVQKNYNQFVKYTS